MIPNAAQMVTTSAKTVEPKTWRHYIDYELVITLMALLGIGIVMLASASFWVAEKEYQNPYYYLQRQVIFLGLGLLFSFIIYPSPICRASSSNREAILRPFWMFRY